MANFITLERKCKWSQTAGAFLVARSDGGAWGLPHQRLSSPSAQTGPGGRRAGRLREQREQMARKVGRWRSERGQSRSEAEAVSVTCGLRQPRRTVQAPLNLLCLAESFKFGGDMKGGCPSGVAQQPWIQGILGSALNQQGPQFAPNPGRLSANSSWKHHNSKSSRFKGCFLNTFSRVGKDLGKNCSPINKR